MQPTQELIDAIYREKVLRARKQSPGQKLLESARLFDYACWITKAGIRTQHPSATESEVLEILKRRLALQDRLESGQ